MSGTCVTSLGASVEVKVCTFCINVWMLWHDPVAQTLYFTQQLLQSDKVAQPFGFIPLPNFSEMPQGFLTNSLSLYSQDLWFNKHVSYTCNVCLCCTD